MGHIVVSLVMMYNYILGRLRVVAVAVAVAVTVAVSRDLPYRGIAYYLMSKVWSECKYSV